MEIQQPFNLDPADFVSSLNGLTGDVTLAQGTGITLSTLGNTITITNTLDLSSYVQGPASSVDNRIALFDSTTGKLIKDSGHLLSEYTALTTGTRATIVASTPTIKTLARSTDTNEFFVYDLTSWTVIPSILIAQPNGVDMGYVEHTGASQLGVTDTYITDKDLSNVAVKGNARTGKGNLRTTLDTTTFLEVYDVYLNSAWRRIAAGFDFYEDTTVNGTLQEKPSGFTEYIDQYSGNGQTLGLNGLPLIQQYVVSMGAYPVPLEVNGGTF